MLVFQAVSEIQPGFPIDLPIQLGPAISRESQPAHPNPLTSLGVTSSHLLGNSKG